MTKPFLSPHATDNYRPDIDGLRAFAVLSVVLDHAFPKEVRGGYVGVDIFLILRDEHIDHLSQRAGANSQARGLSKIRRFRNPGRICGDQRRSSSFRILLRFL
jgi:hypothetical protein